MFALIEPNGRSHALTGGGPWTIGRHRECDIVLAGDPYCARRQCELSVAGDTLYVAPISENSPTYIDERPVDTRARVRAGNRLRFGQTEMTVRARSGVDASGEADDELSVSVPAGSTVIGREPGAHGIALDHPTVSRRHAEFGLKNGTPWLRDLGSTNGTFVNGQRITRGVALRDGDTIAIGPTRFAFAGGQLVQPRRTGTLSISARAVAMDVRVKGEMLRILHPCNVTIRRGEFVCLIGGSGAGKSTLMNVLSGRLRASEGNIEIMGADLAREFEALKPYLAHVPQREVLHDLLTVRTALGFIAELRLPLDMSAQDRATEIAAAAEAVEMTAHLDKPFAKLSGGQKKRACLAAEILCKPQVLFLDEVTSGLDEQTDFEIMQLLSRIAKGGTTIVCVTHNLANIPRFCDRVVVMGSGGYLVFDGPPAEALTFMRVERLGEIFARVTPHNVEQYAERFRKENSRARIVDADSGATPWANVRSPGLLHLALDNVNQFGVLLRRNVALLAADYNTLALVGLQALIIGTFLGLALSDFGSDRYQIVASKKILLTLLTMSAIWIGCNGASKDIICEAAILRQEKNVNLSLATYLLSKMVTAFLFTSLQIAIMFALVATISGGIPGNAVMQLIMLCVAGCVAVMMGLLVSAASTSPAQATAIVPMFLVPQLIFIGTIVPKMPKVLADLSAVIVPTNVLNASLLSIWARDGRIPDPPAPPGPQTYFATRPLTETLALTGVHFLVLALATYLVLRWRYRQGAKD